MIIIIKQKLIIRRLIIIIMVKDKNLKDLRAKNKAKDRIDRIY